MTDDASTLKWLQDAPAASAHALEMLAMTPPATATGFYRPNSVEDFCAAQQKCLDDGRVLMLDPSTDLEVSAPLPPFILRQHSFANGLWAYGARFRWKVPDGEWSHTMFTYSTDGGPDGQESQYFTLAGLSINGDQTGGSQPSPQRLVDLHARSGRAIRGFQIDDLSCMGGQTGLWIEGEVFEGYVNRMRASWMRNAGIVCRHQYDIPGVLSNVYIIGPNITRCPINMGLAMGIHCDRANSVMIEQGNFISLDGPAIYGDAGVKRISNCDFENTGNAGGAAIVMDRADFWSDVLYCEGSNTNGYMKYLLQYGGNPANLEVVGCRNYGGEVMRTGATQAGAGRGQA